MSIAAIWRNSLSGLASPQRALQTVDIFETEQLAVRLPETADVTCCI
jgi:hypothetical protein